VRRNQKHVSVRQKKEINLSTSLKPFSLLLLILPRLVTGAHPPPANFIPAPASLYTAMSTREDGPHFFGPLLILIMRSFGMTEDIVLNWRFFPSERKKNYC